jgi:hypothetical protein
MFNPLRNDKDKCSNVMRFILTDLAYLMGSQGCVTPIYLALPIGPVARYFIWCCHGFALVALSGQVVLE